MMNKERRFERDLEERMHETARRFRARCHHVPGFQKLYEKILLEEIGKGPIQVETISQMALTQLCALDPVKHPSIKKYDPIVTRTLSQGERF